MHLHNTRNRRVRSAGAAVLISLFAYDAAAATPAATDYCIVSDGAIGCVSERAVVELTTRRKDANTLKDLVQEKLASGQCRLFGYGERVSLVSARGTERASVRRPGDKTAYWMPAGFAHPATECEPNASAATLRRKLGLLPDADDATARNNEGANGSGFASSAGEDAPAFSDRGEPAWFGDDDRRAFDGRREEDAPFDDDDDGRRVARRREAPQFADDDPRSFALRHDRYPRYGANTRRPPPWPAGPLPSSRYAHDCAYKPVMSDAELAACRRLRR